MRKAVITLFTSLLTLLAFANVAAATTVMFYQPEVPEKLLRK